MGERGTTGMILAAGLGTRLRPLTRYLPKPLLPVLGRPLLSIIADAFVAAGITRAAVNTHHLSEQIAEYLETASAGSQTAETPGTRFTVFHEPQILGTGGALVGAREFLDTDDDFLLYNGDVLCDLDLRLLLDEHRRNRARTGAVATLVLTDWPRVNSVVLRSDGTIGEIAGKLGAAPSAGDRPLTYTGIAAFSREIFDYLPAGFSSLADALVATLRARVDAVRGLAPDDLYWNDLGTVGRLLDVHRQLLGGRRPRFARRLLAEREIADPVGPETGAGGGAMTPRGAPAKTPILVAAGARLDPGATLEGFCFVDGGATLGADCRLVDCVVLPGADIEPGTELRDAIVGSDFVVTREQNDVLGARIVNEAGFGECGAADDPEGDACTVTPITGHGSDRRFWRLRAGDRRAVLMQSPPADEEFDRFVAIGRFLHEQELGGPDILAADHVDRQILMTDHGRRTLCVASAAATTAPDHLYRPVIDLLVELQVRGTAMMDACPEACDRQLDYETLRWETDYFRRRFLHGVIGLPPADLECLDDDFRRLAEAALAQPVVLIHRDFQSQNIVVSGAGDAAPPRIGLVDFQGMRRGPIAYDLMSMLRDAYVDLGETAIDSLREYYRRQLATHGGPDLDPTVLRVMATVAGLQRSMQALGAFGYLSEVKGKSGFRRYIPLCWRHLRAGLRDVTALQSIVPAAGAVSDDLFPGPLPELARVVADLGEAATRER